MTELLELRVTAPVAGGAGLARAEDGRVVFVDGAVPGELVRVALTDRRRDYARGQVVEVVEAAAERVAPPCPEVGRCGGCDWQHVHPDAQPRFKAAVVADALRRQARLEVEVAVGPRLPDVGYRTTIRGLAVEGRFGFRERAAHAVHPIDDCLVAHPALAELLAEGRFPDGPVVLRVGARTGERLALVHGDPAAVRLPDDVRVVGERQLRAGRRAWFHEEAAGRRWRISARSFFQARPDGAEALVALVTEALAGQPPERTLVDLYGGVGLFAGTVPAAAAVLVEQGTSSVADARVNLADRSLKVVRTDVARWRPTPADAVVADPPRAGLGPAVVAAIGATGARRLALVSCDPAALGRDARLLVDAGWTLRGVTTVDLFPHTNHVEVVSRFDRPD